MVYGRQQAEGVAAHRNSKAPGEKLVEVEGCHEAIVSHEDFERARALLAKGQHYGKSTRPLAGKIKCGVCGHAMPLHKGKEPYFACGTKWYDSECGCGDFRVGQAELYEVLTMTLQKQIELRVEQDALRQVKAEKQNRIKADLEQRLAVLRREAAQSKEKMRKQFERFACGALAQVDFERFQLQNKVQIAQLENKIGTIEQQIAEFKEKNEDLGIIILTGDGNNDIMLRNRTEASLELLDAAICEVRLWPDGVLEIVWGFGEN